MSAHDFAVDPDLGDHPESTLNQGNHVLGSFDEGGFFKEKGVVVCNYFLWKFDATQ